MSAMTMIGNISGVSVPITAASNAINAAVTFFTIIDAPEPDTSGEKGEGVPMDEDIKLENVNFAYPTRADIKVFQNLSLHFPVGKTTAIVGPSGSGKSTIVALIQRWYEVDPTNAIVSIL
jgi:ATP-binding cassette, subfamily B (MDR/TAP), member 1